MCVVSQSCLCRWQVLVYVYCASRIPVQLKYTQCSIMLHLIDICFLPCICLWRIAQIQTCLHVVVGPGFVLTTAAYMRSNASHPSSAWSALACQIDSSMACRMCRVEPQLFYWFVVKPCCVEMCGILLVMYRSSVLLVCLLSLIEVIIIIIVVVVVSSNYLFP